MKKIKHITIDAIILAYKRREYLSAVVAGIRRQSCVRDIYIFHNAPSSIPLRGKGICNIVSERNFGCMPRHAIALLTNADYVLFVDDDTELCEDFSERLYAAIKKYPRSIIGLFGRDIDETVAANRLYPSGGYYDETVVERYVDIIAGRVLLCKREWFRHLFSLPFYHEFFDEDIMLNLSVQNELRTPSVMIASSSKEYVDLTVEHGANLRSDHLQKRSIVVKRCIDAGWTSFRKNGRIRQHTVAAGKKIARYFKTKTRLVTQFNAALQRSDASGIEENAMALVRLGRENMVFTYNAASFFYGQENVLRAKRLYRRVVRDAYRGDRQLIGLAYYKLALIAADEGKGSSAKGLLRKCISLYPEHKNAQVMFRDFSLNPKHAIGNAARRK